MIVTIEVSPGELIDRLTILEIKEERFAERAPEKLLGVQKELFGLRQVRDRTLQLSDPVVALAKELKKVNETLWEIEDAIRDCEREKDFGPRFIERARAVYQNNDRRAALKRQINTALGSKLGEEKLYHDYSVTPASSVG